MWPLFRPFAIIPSSGLAVSEADFEFSGGTMKAWVHYGFNDMRLEEIPDPKIEPKHVIVKVKVVQPSITEVLLSRGLPTFPKVVDAVKQRFSQKTPAQLFGHEFCGEIVEVGDDVTSLKKGDRVTAKASIPCHRCFQCRSGREHFCSDFKLLGFDMPGALAEYALIPEEILFKLPDAISDSEGATMQPLAECVTAVVTVGLNHGDTLVVLGQGAMGLSSMQAAKTSGAGRIIVTDIRDEALAMARSLGVDEAINARERDPVKRVLELTDGAGAEIVVDAASGSPEVGLAGFDTFFQAAEMVSVGGKILQMAHFEKPIESLATGPFRSKSIKWIFPDLTSNMTMRHTINLVASGRIKQEPLITHIIDQLENLREVFEITINKPKYRTLNPAQLRIA
jgi:threonine dehydrogenase-like Zn-dependent dehydrogenase